MGKKVEDLNDKEMQAVARLMLNEDFAFIIDYLRRVSFDLMSRSRLLEGSQCYRVQGGSLTVDDILEQFLTARDTIAHRQDVQRQKKLPTVF